MVLAFGQFMVISAQGFVPLFNEYLAENLYVIHPAMEGVNLKNARINLGSRQQWFNVPNAPRNNNDALAFYYPSLQHHFMHS